MNRTLRVAKPMTILNILPAFISFSFHGKI
jgi:hypothetical protein